MLILKTKTVLLNLRERVAEDEIAANVAANAACYMAKSVRVKESLQSVPLRYSFTLS